MDAFAMIVKQMSSFKIPAKSARVPTPRQAEIRRLLTEGRMTQRQIAYKLDISKGLVSREAMRIRLEINKIN